MWFISLEWLLCLVLVFWCVGAYRRLLRLRAACRSSFEGLDSYFRQTLALLQAFGADADPEQSEDRPARQALLATAQWLEQTLDALKLQPLQRDGMAGLESAWQALQVAWQAHARVVLAQASGPAAVALPGWQARWQQLQAVQAHAAEPFNQAVAAYNRAIAQFPAVVMARVLGMAPGRCLQAAMLPLALPSRSTIS